MRLRNETQAGWSNIDVQLKRRNDLIPNLVEAVKGYASHERGLFDEITQARAAVPGGGGPAQTAAASDQLTGAMGKLFAVAENYPQLRATENFQELQSELTDTEDKIAAARRYYNSVVQTYNSAIQSFPALLYAGMLGFRRPGVLRGAGLRARNTAGLDDVSHDAAGADPAQLHRDRGAARVLHDA